MSSAKELNKILQEAVAGLPNAPKFPIGFAGARSSIDSLKKYFTARSKGIGAPFPIGIPCYELLHPERFGISSSELLPIMDLAELYAIGKVDQLKTDTDSTQSKALYNAHKKEFLESGGSIGVLNAQWLTEIDITGGAQQ